MQIHQLVGLSFLLLLLARCLNGYVMQSCEFENILCLFVNQGSNIQSTDTHKSLHPILAAPKDTITLNRSYLLFHPLF